MKVPDPRRDKLFLVMRKGHKSGRELEGERGSMEPMAVGQSVGHGEDLQGKKN